MFLFFCFVNLSNGNIKLKLRDLCLQFLYNIIILRDGQELMFWNQQINCDRYVFNNLLVVFQFVEDICVQKCVKSIRQFVRYDINFNNDFKLRKRYEVDGKIFV